MSSNICCVPCYEKLAPLRFKYMLCSSYVFLHDCILHHLGLFKALHVGFRWDLSFNTSALYFCLGDAYRYIHSLSSSLNRFHQVYEHRYISCVLSRLLITSIFFCLQFHHPRIHISYCRALRIHVSHPLQKKKKILVASDLPKDVCIKRGKLHDWVLLTPRDSGAWFLRRKIICTMSTWYSKEV